MSAAIGDVILLDTDAFSGVFRDPGDHRFRSITEGRRLVITLFTCAEALAGAAQANWGPLGSLTLRTRSRAWASCRSR